MTTPIPLSHAALCVDCAHISANLRQCAKCGSYAVMSLANVLDRDPQRMTAEDRSELKEMGICLSK